MVKIGRGRSLTGKEGLSSWAVGQGSGLIGGEQGGEGQGTLY